MNRKYTPYGIVRFGELKSKGENNTVYYIKNNIHAKNDIVFIEHTSDEIEEIKDNMKRQEESIELRKLMFPNEEWDWDPYVGVVDIDDMYCPWKYDENIT